MFLYNILFVKINTRNINHAQATSTTFLGKTISLPLGFETISSYIHAEDHNHTLENMKYYFTCTHYRN